MLAKNTPILLKTLLVNSMRPMASTRKVDPYSGQNLPEPPVNPNRLKNKVAIITGAGDGVGKETAILFARSGIEGLIVADINEEKGLQVAATLNKELGKERIHFIRTDVGNSKQVENMVEEAVKKFGKLNVLVNNAGIMHSDDDTPVSTSEDVWDLTMNINLKAIFMTTKYAIPHMLKTGNASIINIASFVAKIGAATPQIAYTTSKGGVISMTKEIAMIYARQGIRANALCPGPLRTPLLMKFLENEEKMNRRLVHIPMGRFGEAREIAQAIAFLASDESSYITGSEFMADGGVTSAYVTPE